MSSKKNKHRSNTPSSNKKAYSQQQLDLEKSLSPATLQAYNDTLEDVHTRFILNLPPEELATSDRLFFQIEQAWWYYEDIICDEMEEDGTVQQPISYLAAINKVHLPRFKKLQPFARKLFEISPMLSPLMSQFDDLWSEFSRYRRKISTYGTVLLNRDCTKVVLCQDYNGKAWTFPAGKVNQNEKGMDAGARETYEETGFDINCNLGLARKMSEDNPKVPWNELKDTDGYMLRYTEGDGSGKLRTCYVCHGVPEEFPFAPVARKEVSAVEWFDIANLPKKTFAVIPFMKGLKKWIRKSPHGKKRNKTPKSGKRSVTPKVIMKRPATKSSSRNGSRNPSVSKGRRSNTRSSRNSTPGKNMILQEEDDLFEAGLGEIGDDNRWSEDDMFKVNEKLIGRKVEYDGNPQLFATNGFDGIDPHAFRVVQGGFMNSGEKTIAKSPSESKLQPLFRAQNGQSGENNNDELQPFFSEGGATPWGEIASDTLLTDEEDRKAKKKKIKSKSLSASSSNSSSVETCYPGKANATNARGLSILSMLRKGEGDVGRTIPAVSNPVLETNKTEATKATVDVFMTDGEITARSQKEKTEFSTDEDTTASEPKRVIITVEANESAHARYLCQWVKNLPASEPTTLFGDFRFDFDKIMASMKVKN